MTVTQENDQEVIIEAEVLGQNQIAVIESMNEVDSSGRVAEESIARTVIPYLRDDDKARYLGLRASAFTSREAMKLIGSGMSALSNWRADPEFKSLEDRLPEFRKVLADEYCELEFVRNYRLVMAKDHEVLQKSMKLNENDQGDMTKFDQDYLLKMRAYYTPQQLNIVTALAKGANSSGDDAFDFTKAVLKIAEHSRTMELTVGD